MWDVADVADVAWFDGEVGRDVKLNRADVSQGDKGPGDHGGDIIDSSLDSFDDEGESGGT